MITVEITNPKARVNAHIGWFNGLACSVAARLRMIDLAEKVQEAIVERLIDELGAENVHISVSGPSKEAAEEK